MKAYLFDVDGVLSDPVEKQVLEEGLFGQIIQRLQQGEPVGLNTGRSTAWLVARFIKPLLERIEDKSILQNFIAIGEKGGTWMTIDIAGDKHHGEIREIALPQEIIGEVKLLIDQKYRDCMFFDSTKETMLSIEMRDGLDLDIFHQKQQVLVEDLRKLLEEKGLEGKYRIDPTTIATDVESPIVGKALGAEHFLEFLQEIKLDPQEFETFGDSKSDFEMADELHRRGKKVKMIYVGDRTKLREFLKEYMVEYVDGFSRGTLQYLRSH